MNCLLRCLFVIFCLLPEISIAQLKCNVQKNDKSINIISKGKTCTFSGDFVIIDSVPDPNLSMNPAEVKFVSYNVPTWKAYKGKTTDLNQARVNVSTGGGGLDDRRVKSSQEGRTPGILNSGKVFGLRTVSISMEENIVKFNYKTCGFFSFEAFVELNNDMTISCQW